MDDASLWYDLAEFIEAADPIIEECSSDTNKSEEASK